MPISLNDMRRKTRVLPIDYFGDTFEVEYMPAKMTPAKIDELRALNDSDAYYDDEIPLSYAEEMVTLFDFIVHWDITDEAGNELPVSAEVIRQLPMKVINSIVAAVVEDSRPTEKKSRRSRGSFS